MHWSGTMVVSCLDTTFLHEETIPNEKALGRLNELLTLCLMRYLTVSRLRYFSAKWRGVLPLYRAHFTKLHDNNYANIIMK